MIEHKARIADAEFCRTLWSERFDLPFPEDFLKNWTARRSMDVISAFNDAKVFLNQYPDRGTLDLAKMISASVRRSNLAREYDHHNHYTLQTAKQSDYVQLWRRYFPTMGLPSSFLEFWCGSHRKINVVTMAFKIGGRIYKDDPARTAVELCKIISAQMAKLAIQHEQLVQR